MALITTSELIEDEKYKAWILNFGAGVRAAVAFHEMSQVLLSPTLFRVPMTPPHCSHVLNLRKKLLPVMNLARLLAPIAMPDTVGEDEEDSGIVGISVYQTEPETPLQYVAFNLETLPLTVFVNDEQACELPPNPLWKLFSLSSFLYDGYKIPLLDLAALFSEEVREQLNKLEAI